jgi:hypothetical protein
MGDLAQLNRLRVNAGKGELKSWKASRESLDAQIQKFLDDGFTDALPGANIQAAPVLPPDPEIIKALTPPAEEARDEEVPSLADSALGKMVTPKDDDKPKKEVTKVKGKLARGLETDTMAVQSRAAVQSRRSQEKRDEAAANKKPLTKKEKKRLKKMKKLAKLSETDKAQIKDEAASRNITGKVDAAKEPDKAARQAKHVADKQKARAEKPAKEKDDKTFTVADVARELDIDPKVARAKLRRYEGKDSYPKTIKGERWAFPIEAKSTIRDILSGKK